MPVAERDLSTHVIQAFPPWLDLPPGYIVNDWIAWQKGKLVAKRLRENPSLVQEAICRLEAHGVGLFAADFEWLDLLRNQGVESIASILESDDGEGQRLRSSTPFCRTPFVYHEEMDAIRNIAWIGE